MVHSIHTIGRLLITVEERPCFYFYTLWTTEKSYTRIKA